MADSIVLLAHRYEKAKLDSPAGWLMSEKLDGVRGYWNGERFVSRNNKPIHAPDWFTERLPRGIHLDGELWLARGEFNRCSGIVRRHDWGDEGKQIKFVCFDAPEMRGSFQDRLQFVHELMADLRAPWVSALKHERVKSFQHMRTKLEKIEAQGGEGLILRDPTSPYERKRSWSCLKVKSFQDGEAIVVDHQAGKGKHKGRLGALVCELPSGKRFKIGTGFTDAQREDPPAPGTMVTYGFFEESKDGIPRFPTFIGVRAD